MKSLSSRPHVAMTIDVGDTRPEAKALLVCGLASVDIVDGVSDEYIAVLRLRCGPHAVRWGWGWRVSVGTGVAVAAELIIAASAREPP